MYLFPQIKSNSRISISDPQHPQPRELIVSRSRYLITMKINSTLDAIDPHAYGLRAASNCDPLIEQLFKSTSNADLSADQKLIAAIPDADRRDRANQALIHFAHTGDRESAAQMIKGREYLIANLQLGKHMHALRMHSEKPVIDFPIDPIDPIDEIDEMPNHPNRGANYRPIFTSIIDVLTETQMAAHAPTAAISAATNSII